MNEKIITREALLESFSSLATQFSQSLKNAQTLEKKFDSTRAQLIQSIDKHLKKQRAECALAR